MASVSSVITGGFGVPGSASLVITDGYGIGAAAPVSDLIGRPSRRGRRPLWHLLEDGQKLVPEALKEEQAYVQSLVSEADVYSLLEETRILREALELATAKQRKTISTMMKKLERRMVEIEDDEAAIVLLM